MPLSAPTAEDREQPLVTVCVPTIGRTTMLHDALESVRRQTYANIEILLLDNAAEGEGQQILRRFAASEPRARVLRCEPRLPMFANFNRGIRAARGAYVTFLFDDDLLQPEAIARAVAVLTRFPSAGYAGSNYELIDATGRVTGQSSLVAETAVVPGRQHIRDQMRCVTMILATPGIVYRRDLVAAFPFDESLNVYGGDLVMRLRMAEVTDVALIAEPLVRVRVHPQAETARLSATESFVTRTGLLQAYIAEYRQRWPDDGAFAWSLQSRLALAHSAPLVWDWIALGDEAKAAQRRAGLGAVPGGAKLAAMLAASERLGLTAARRRAKLAPLVRRLGPIVPTPFE